MGSPYVSGSPLDFFIFCLVCVVLKESGRLLIFRFKPKCQILLSCLAYNFNLMWLNIPKLSRQAGSVMICLAYVEGTLLNLGDMLVILTVYFMVFLLQFRFKLR
jgi:hypothetical protein